MLMDAKPPSRAFGSWRQHTTVGKKMEPIITSFTVQGAKVKVKRKSECQAAWVHIRAPDS